MKAVRRVILAIGVLVALAWASFSGGILKPFLEGTFFNEIPYGRAAAVTLLDILLLSLVIGLVGGVGLLGQARLSGLTAPIGRALIFAGLLFVPASVVSYWLAPVSGVNSIADYVWGAVGAPLFEEIGYRGLALGALMRLCRWRFLAAALAPAALFGLAHLWQGEGPAEIAGVVAITGLGGLLFGWLFVRWGYNLWPAIFLHAGLNTLWMAFDLGENAVGGWFGNAIRFSIVAGAVILTLLLSPGPEKDPVRRLPS
jgi:membrane protease YdiL (CAAX protease family)